MSDSGEDASVEVKRRGRPVKKRGRQPSPKKPETVTPAAKIIETDNGEAATKKGRGAVVAAAKPVVPAKSKVVKPATVAAPRGRGRPPKRKMGRKPAAPVPAPAAESEDNEEEEEAEDSEGA